MEEWDHEFVDAEVDGYFEFAPKHMGSFQFGYVRGQIDHRQSTRDGQPCVEFTWDGNDEMDPAMGRGWVVLNGNEMNGMIVLHQGDESAFKAKKVNLRVISRKENPRGKGK